MWKECLQYRFRISLFGPLTKNGSRCGHPSIQGLTNNHPPIISFAQELTCLFVCGITGTTIKVGKYDLVIEMILTPIFGANFIIFLLLNDQCPFEEGRLKVIFYWNDFIMCSKYFNRSNLNDQHNWEELWGLLVANCLCP